MATYTPGPEIGGIAGAAIGQYLRVKLDSSNEFVLAGDEAFVGANQGADTLAQGDEMHVLSANCSASGIYIASKAIAVGDTVSTVAGGKVTDAAGVVVIGTAKTAAAADTDSLEVIHTKRD